MLFISKFSAYELAGLGMHLRTMSLGDTTGVGSRLSMRIPQR